MTDLLALHERLLTTAGDTEPSTLFTNAADIVRHLIRQHTYMNPYGITLDLRSETQAAVTAILGVLRHEAGTEKRTASGALRTAKGWADHASLRLDAAETEFRRQRDSAKTPPDALPVFPAR
ncbi:hypothetical protein BS329_15530 [Amycolatopsis coloradensis]|uniref:Uncharacterized protein n=1 Tax=Amycolatopsis coloradensis TaxID=76021 RepID=A0A1R0KU89_9PSEU|nr:hypothetical protein [Amycolatopsis coloradensis]OLZ51674.1 hypothetical protein BS329_15530 [Amycolatopsis coloradensis]